MLNKNEFESLGGTGTCTVHEPCPCPQCGYKLDACSHAAGHDNGQPNRATPKTGDLSICINCGSVNEIQSVNPMVMTIAAPEKLKSLPLDIQKAIWTLRLLRNKVRPIMHK